MNADVVNAIDAWRDAYEAAHKRPAPVLTFEDGWVVIHGFDRRVRLLKLRKMTVVLRGYARVASSAPVM